MRRWDDPPDKPVPKIGITSRRDSGVATIHYTTCYAYQRSMHKQQPLAYGVKVKPCRTCKPTEEHILRDLPQVEYDEYSKMPGASGFTRRVTMNVAEKEKARKDYGDGRKRLTLE